MKILIVEDSIELAQTIADELAKNYIVDVCHSGAEALKHIEENQYDALILDIVLPDISGIKLCRKIRKENYKTPILMLTGKTEVSTVVKALNAGADDYLKKPFVFPELRARIKALLRRQTNKITSKIITVGEISLDLNTKRVKRKDKIIALRRKELYLLEYLMRNKGILITRTMIMDSVWESSSQPEKTNTVDVHMKTLRDQIDKDFDKKMIITIPGLGYMLEA